MLNATSAGDGDVGQLAAPLEAAAVGVAIAIAIAIALASFVRAAIRDRPSAAAVARMREIRVEPRLDGCFAADGGAERNVIKCVNPATGAVLGEVPNMGADNVAERVERARAAQARWASTSFGERRRVLRLLASFVLLRQREICAISCLDTGKTMLDASLGEVLTSLEKLRWLVAEGEAALRPDRRSTGPLTVHRVATLEFVPLGVIAAISPWNYPFHNLLNPLSAALFAGNALVVKPSEHSSYSTACYVRALRELLAAAGADPELLQLVTGDGTAGAALVQARGVDKVFFTGSTRVGHAVATLAAQRLLPVVLELGGKDAFVVLDDADLELAHTLAMRGVFQNGGQNCIGIERVLLQDKVHDVFVQRAEPIVRALRVDADVGAMTLGAAELDRLEALVADAVRNGARVLCGGRRAAPRSAGAAAGCFFEPTLLVDVDVSMRISQEEVFGPIMAVFRFSSDADAVAIANASPFGLSFSVFSTNAARADRVLAAVRTGMGNVNDFAVNYLCQSLPFGGTKLSGSDRFAGIEGLRGCCLMRSITRDRFPWPLRTALPKPLQYPVAPGAYAFAHALNELIYAGVSPLMQLRALATMLRVLLASGGGGGSGVASGHSGDGENIKEA